MLERRDIILSSEANYKQNADPEMKKASKAGAKRATRATRSREPSTTSEPKRTAKGWPKKQSISGQPQSRQKQGEGLEQRIPRGLVNLSVLLPTKLARSSKTLQV
jgi:hypothetical protein